MNATATHTICKVEDFLVESGALRSMTLDAAIIRLRWSFNRIGHVAVVHRHDNKTLRLRVMLHQRWHCADAEGLERRIVSLVLAANPYAGIDGVELRKMGCYVDMLLGLD